MNTIRFEQADKRQDPCLYAYHLNSGKDLTVELVVREAGGNNGGQLFLGRELL